ncbi:hypothetical protein GCM10022290_32760 [Sagittula marina]
MALKHLKYITSILTIGALIAALAAAAPAQAADRDKTKALIGTVATVWLLHELNKNGAFQKAERKDERSRSYSGHQRGAEQWRRHNGNRKAASKPALPRHCLRETRRHGLVLGSGCLNRNYRAVRHLPQACHTNFRANGQRRSGYDYSCLRNRGFSIARR